MAIMYFTDHIARNREKLNLEYLADFIGVTYHALIQAIERKVDSKGRQVKLPKPCLPKLVIFFKELVL